LSDTLKSSIIRIFPATLVLTLISLSFPGRPGFCFMVSSASGSSIVYYIVETLSSAWFIVICSFFFLFNFRGFRISGIAEGTSFKHSDLLPALTVVIWFG
jgi:hypothetical protein